MKMLQFLIKTIHGASPGLLGQPPLILKSPKQFIIGIIKERSSNMTLLNLDQRYLEALWELVSGR